MAYQSDKIERAGYGADAAATPRESREVEALVEKSRRLAEIAMKAVARTGDMKGRLLGIVEPSAGGKDGGPKSVPCELTELRQNLEALDSYLDRLHENITVLERV